MLGRDPTAGLASAREWAQSSNPDVIEDAAVGFRDIDGYDNKSSPTDPSLRG